MDIIKNKEEFILKKVSIILLIFLLVVAVIPKSVLAAPDQEQNVYSEVPTTGTPSPYSDYGVSPQPSTFPKLNFHIESISPHFADFGCSISKSSSTSIKGSAFTNATLMADRVGYYLNFQMWNGYRWENIGTVTQYVNNYFRVSSSHIKSVVSGNYYRVQVNHYITVNGTTYNQTSTSDYIYIN